MGIENESVRTLVMLHFKSNEFNSLSLSRFGTILYLSALMPAYLRLLSFDGCGEVPKYLLNRLISICLLPLACFEGPF